MNEKLKAILIVILVVSLLISAVYIVYAVTTYLSIPSSGTILTTAGLTATPTSINWGDIPAGSTTPLTRDITLQNTGQQSTLPLNMTASTTTYGIVTWTGENAIILAGAQQIFTLTFTPSASAPAGSFSFNIIIGSA